MHKPSQHRTQPRRRAFSASVALLLCFLPAPILLANTWHVSPTVLKNRAADRQFRSINEAARVAAPGDTVVLHSGVYREAVVIARSGTRAHPISFETAPSANVVVTGVDPLIGWRKEPGPDNIYSIDWPYRFAAWTEKFAYPADEFHRLIGRAEQVMIDRYPLQQTLVREPLPRGCFFVDLEAKRLYVSPQNGGEVAHDLVGELTVEAATRAVLWNCTGDYVSVRGIRFRYAANAAQQAAVLFAGRGDVAQDCVFERMNAVGASFAAPDQTARRCIFQDNGQLGFSAIRAHNLLLTGCTIRNNNTKGFNRGWEAGGNKLVLSRGVILEKSEFVANRGSGIWFDIGNENCTVRNCLIADNEDAGIFYEISYGLFAHDNVVIGNGLAPNAGAWGAQAGISLSSSADCLLERNLLLANREGFNFREQSRTTPRIDDKPGAPETPVWNQNDTIRRNIIAYNRDAQTWGWFDVRDERHWPRRLQETRSEKESNEWSLERLRLHLSDNLYATQDAQPLFVWGPSWTRHSVYSTLHEVRRELHLESRSRLLPFTYRDYSTRDFRIPRNSPARRLKCYPRGNIPGVKLGLWSKPGSSDD